MFLRPNTLNNLMKKAYKSSGFRLAMNENDWLYIASDWWQVCVRKDFIPKKTLGDIVALAGEIPKAGEYFVVTRMGNQYEVEVPMEIDETPYNNAEYLTVTDLLMIGDCGTIQRLLQSEDTGRIYAVNNVFIEIVDNSLIDEEHGEYSVNEPLYHPLSGILWRNNVCKLRAHFRNDDKNMKLMKELQSGIDITPAVLE